MIKAKIFFLVFILMLKIEIHYSLSNSKTFRCVSNKHYIFDEWFCDGAKDCDDNSDESYGCDKARCGRGNFTCKNSQCVPITSRCNKMKDCADGSDELFCDHEPNTLNCALNDGKYLCKDKLKCVDLMVTCDGRPNCFDGSDENENCSKSGDVECVTCLHPCIRTPDGPKCFCNSNDPKLNDLCKGMKECGKLTPNNCFQKCVLYEENTQCSCSENYEWTFTSSGAECVSHVSEHNMILYSTPESVKLRNLTSGEMLIMHNITNCTALTAAYGYIYYAAGSNDEESIFKISSNPTKRAGPIEVIKGDLTPIDSIAVDWITGNIYFTKSESLSVCTNNGQICTELKSLKNAEGSVALAPKYGLMFWTSISDNKSFIMTSALDGSNERILVEESLRYPTSLTIDETAERILWYDRGTRKLETIQFNGNYRVVVAADNRKNYKAFTKFENAWFGIFPFDNTIFFSDGSKPIEKIMDNGNTEITNFFVYNPFLQRTKISNPCTSACAGLCLLRPTASKVLNSTCICEHFKPSNGNSWCKDQLVKSGA